MNRTIRLHIDELVLDGFAPLDRAAVGAAVQAELARLLSEQGLPGGLEFGGEAPTVDGGAFNLPANARAESIGAEIARSVYGGLGK
jgi:hypothetical protein